MTAAPAFAAAQAAPAPAAAPASAAEGVANTAPAAAPAAQPAAQVSAIDKKDPVICQRQQEIGSLLHAKKVCMTKSQWEAQRQADRSNIERSQIQRGMDPVQ
ncbi:hypothetical protein WBP07_09285 [Novosphingobium sp. BL-8A]|uniref:hypothetical protein n=1 Tax=Novosphingobium sp. BL-8A TaxID=3127639 RepID=UPI003758090B